METSDTDETKKPINKEDRLTWAKKRLDDATSANRNARKEMKEDFSFAAGKQWDATDEEALREQGRPVLTFNFIKPYIDVIGGLAEQNKTRARAMPVDPTDQFLCDVLNDIGYWVYNRYNITADEDDAFENATIAGLGAVAMDVSADPKRYGEIKFALESVYPCEIHFDPASRKSDYSDAGYVFWEKWMTKEDFKIYHPEFADDIDEFFNTGKSFEAESTISGSSIDSFDTDTEDNNDYNELDIDYYDRQKEKIRVLHMEYWEAYDKYVGFNPITGQVEEFNKKNLDIIKKRFPEFEYSKIKDKKLKWFQFIGDRVLYDDETPLPINGFSLVPITAYKDKQNGISNYYGVTRPLKDPQREINKRWSQTLNLLNNQVQGGVYAETDAFQDVTQAEESMKESGAITWLKKGALTKGKFQEKTIPKFPDAPMRMQEFSNQALRFISGINPDLLGQDRGRQEPGVVVRMRQQQGMTIISKLFKNLNLAKQRIFENILSCVIKYMPDTQILRILGEGDRYAIQGDIIIDKKTNNQTPLRDLRNIEYNVSVQSAPGNMTKVAYELSTLTEMAGNGLPVDPKMIISKLDLPADEKATLIQYVDQRQQAESQAAQQEMKAKYGLEGAKLQQKTDLAMKKLALDVEKLQQKIQEGQGKLAVERMNLKDEVTQKERDSRRKHSIDVAELEVDQRKLVFDLIAQFTTNVNRQNSVAQ